MHHARNVACISHGITQRRHTKAIQVHLLCEPAVFLQDNEHHSYQWDAYTQWQQIATSQLVKYNICVSRAAQL